MTAPHDTTEQTTAVTRLIRQAWLELKHALRDGDKRGVVRAERRMDALLDRL